MKKIFQFIQNLLFPPHCTLCDCSLSKSSLFCDPCKADLPWKEYGCKQCGESLADERQTLCGKCLENPPSFDRIFALFEFKKPISTLISQLKFKEKLFLSRVFGCLLAEKIHSTWYLKSNLPEVIIPVPLHRKRLKEIGFNQANEIARFIKKVIPITIDNKACHRIKATKAQSELAAKERINNVKNAFRCTTPFPYQHVALLDDVVTTGNTISEISRLLKKAGVKQIDVWCCAKTGNWD